MDQDDNGCLGLSAKSPNSHVDGNWLRTCWTWPGDMLLWLVWSTSQPVRSLLQHPAIFHLYQTEKSWHTWLQSQSFATCYHPLTIQLPPTLTGLAEQGPRDPDSIWRWRKLKRSKYLKQIQRSSQIFEVIYGYEQQKTADATKNRRAGKAEMRVIFGLLHLEFENDSPTDKKH